MTRTIAGLTFRIASPSLWELVHDWPGVSILLAFDGRLEKFFVHGNGIALVPDRTSAPWWQRFAPKADLWLFVSPKLKFIGAYGAPGKSPAQGTCLWAAGDDGVAALHRAAYAGLGILGRPA